MKYKVKADQDHIAVNGVILAKATQKQLKEFYLKGCTHLIEEIKETKKKKPTGEN